MKVFVYILFVLFLSLTACSSSNSPEKQAADFLECVGKRDFSRAKELCTEKSEYYIDMLKVMSASPDSVITGKFPKVEIIASRVSGDTAWVTYLTEDKDQSDMMLIKENDEWKVDLAKE